MVTKRHLRLKTRAGDIIAQRVWQESETDAVQRVLRKARRHLDQSVGRLSSHAPSAFIAAPSIVRNFRTIFRLLIEGDF